MSDNDEKVPTVTEVERGLRNALFVAHSFQTTEREFGIFCGGFVMALQVAEEVNSHDVKVNASTQTLPSIDEFHALMRSEAVSAIVELFLKWKRTYEEKQVNCSFYPSVLSSMDEIYDNALRLREVRRDDPDDPQGLPS